MPAQRTSADRAPGGRRLLLALLRPRRRPLAAAAIWSLIEALPSLVSGLLVAAALDRGFLPGRPVTGLAWLALLGATMVVQAVATRRMFPHLAETAEPLRDDLTRSVVAAAVRHACTGDRPADTAAVTRLTGQVESVRGLVSAILRSSRALGVSVLAALAGLLILSPLAAVVVAVPLLLALVAFARLLRVLVTRERALVLADEELTARATPVLAAVRDIAACGAERQAYAAVEPAVTAQAAATRALAWAGVGRRLVLTLGVHLPLLGLLVAAPSLLRGGHLSLGEAVGAATYLATGLDPALRSFVGLVSTWGVELGVTLRRLAETTGSTDVTGSTGTTGSTGSARSAGEAAASPAPAPAGTPPGHGLRLERVSFAYAPAATPVVSGLDLTIAEGEHLAVVGPSGIGKSTLSMLLTGLRRPTGGQVRLDGVPLEEVPERRLRSEIALAPQEAYVFMGSVRENLAYLCPAVDAEAGDARLRAAVAAVGAGALVERLGGLDGVIEDRSALSTGERQLLALARIHASPARVVILDEATCHLDPAAALRAETAFAAREGTLVVIAHRIASARRAHRILLMDGTTAISGSHEELMDRSPLYARLFAHR